MKKTIGFLLLLVVLPVLSYGALVPGLQSFTVSQRVYDVITPSNYNSSETYPVVFMLHYFGSDKEAMQDLALVNEQEYIGVYPEGEHVALIGGHVWNTWPQTDAVLNNDDVAYLTSVYNQLSGEIGNSFDPDKVYAYGFSNGGAMAMKMVKETTLFKGIAVRAMSLEQGELIDSTAAKVPMVFVHGTADATIPYTGGSGSNIFSPDFEDVKTMVLKWATHNECIVPPQDIYVEGSNTIRDHWLREYSHADYPVYLYALPGSPHTTDGGFTNRNIKRTAIRLFTNPKCYGLSRYTNNCQ